MKPSFLLVIPGLAALVSGPAFAQVQVVTPENTPELCRDGLDNDGDGWVDCADQDCQRLQQCQQAPPAQAAPAQPYPQPPPPGYAPPPPSYPAQPQPPPPAYPQQPTYPGQPYYAPPPYAPPPASEAQPPFGLVTGVIGSALVIVGFGMLMGSVDPWLAADCTAGNFSDPTGNCQHNKLRDTGIVLDVFGGVFFVIGMIMTPIGWMQYKTYRKWKKSHHVSAGPGGLSITF